MEASLRHATWGPLLTSIDVDEAVLTTLKMWLPTYMSQIERERSITPKLDRPKLGSYDNVIDDDQFPDYNLPAVIVTTAQTEGEPQTDGDGNYYAAWNVVVSAITKGRNKKETRNLAAWFEGCVRRALVHQGTDLSGELKWRGSNVAPVGDPTESGRYLAAGMGHYVVYTDFVVQEGVGPFADGGDYPPADPDDPDTPYEPLVTVGKVSVDVQHPTP
jgi:hypothetical protein